MESGLFLECVGIKDGLAGETSEGTGSGQQGTLKDDDQTLGVQRGNQLAGSELG